MKLLTGQITIETMALIASLIFGLGGVWIAQEYRTEDKIATERERMIEGREDVLQRLSTLEEKIQRITIIESKLDALLLNQGIPVTKWKEELNMTPVP